MPAHTLRAPKRQTPTETRDPTFYRSASAPRSDGASSIVHYESAWNFTPSMDGFRSCPS